MQPTYLKGTVVDPKPHFQAPSWKKAMTLVPILGLIGFAVIRETSSPRADFFEIGMILFTLLWMITLYGSFDGMRFEFSPVRPQRQPSPLSTVYNMPRAGRAEPLLP